MRDGSPWDADMSYYAYDVRFSGLTGPGDCQVLEGSVYVKVTRYSVYEDYGFKILIFLIICSFIWLSVYCGPYKPSINSTSIDEPYDFGDNGGSNDTCKSD